VMTDQPTQLTLWEVRSEKKEELITHEGMLSYGKGEGKFHRGRTSWFGTTLRRQDYRGNLVTGGGERGGTSKTTFTDRTGRDQVPDLSSKSEDLPHGFRLREGDGGGPSFPSFFSVLRLQMRNIRGDKVSLGKTAMRQEGSVLPR